MGEPETLHFYDFGILGCVQTHQNQLFSSLETPGYLKRIQESLEDFQKYDVCKSQNFGTPKMSNCEKTRAEQ